MRKVTPGTGMRRAISIGAIALMAVVATCSPAGAANLYVSNFSANTVSQYSVGSDGSLTALSPATVSGGSASATGPIALALSPDRTSLYVANGVANTGNIAQFSVNPDGTLTPKSPATVGPYDFPGAMAFTPDGRHMYVARTSGTANAGKLYEFDVATDGRLTQKSSPNNEIVTGGNQVGAVVVNAAGTVAYVGQSNSGVGQFHIAADGSLSAFSPLFVASGGSQTQGIQRSADGSSLYGVNKGDGSVSRFAVGGDGSLALTATTPSVGGQPNRITLSPDGMSAYVTNANSAFNSISQFSVNADGTLTPKSPFPTVAAPSGPRELVFNPDGHTAYVSAATSANVLLYTVGVDGSLAAAGSVPAAAGAVGIAYSAGPAGSPTAVTGASSAIIDTGATVAGTVTPNGARSFYTFEYGTSLAFGSISPVGDAGSGSSAVPQTATLSGLQPNTTYYYRLVSTSNAGTSFGVVKSFKTTGAVAVAPVATTQAATAITNTSGTLRGQVNPSGQSTVFTFEYGTSTSFGAIVPVIALDDADALEPVSATLTSLDADKTYYYRLVAANATGTTTGAVMRFSTGPGGAPAVNTGSASAVTSSSATLAATVDAHGAQTAFVFEYGTSTAFGSLSAIDNAGDANAMQSVTLGVTGLSPSTTYRFRIVATNATATSAGAVHSFTTTAAGAPPSTGPVNYTIAASSDDALQTHFCAVRTTGRLACWGSNHGGRYGDGSTDAGSATPVPGAPGITDAVQVGAAGENTCALRAGGQIMCWGRNVFGELGDGTIVSTNTPVAVAGIGNATQIATGRFHSCALRAGGTVACWGENGLGQLGDGTVGTINELGSNVPVPVSGLTDAIQVTASRFHSCALRAAGAVVCWGLVAESGAKSPLPSAVPGLTDATQVSAANSRTCALRAGGTIVCWGDDFFTQGQDTTPHSAPVEITGVSDATQVISGEDATCALRIGGTVVCWSNNEPGQPRGGPAGLTDAVQVAVGGDEFCAVRRGGTVACWGSNGGFFNSPEPVDMPGLTDAGKPL